MHVLYVYKYVSSTFSEAGLVCTYVRTYVGTNANTFLLFRASKPRFSLLTGIAPKTLFLAFILLLFERYVVRTPCLEKKPAGLTLT